MATQEVPFNFICRGPSDFTVLEFHHAIPSSLITTTPGPGHRELLSSILGPIIDEHEVATREACTTSCVVCGLEEAKVKIVPSSHLRVVKNPEISIFASSVCDKQACELKAQQNFVEFIKKAGQVAAAEGVAIDNKAYGPCLVCGKMEKTLRCQRCKVACYCGAEHQKEDWVKHKKVCKKPAASALPAGLAA